MIELETMQLKDVPIGGVFILDRSKFAIDAEKGSFGAFVKIRQLTVNCCICESVEFYGDVMFGISFGSATQVAYTGVVLHE